MFKTFLKNKAGATAIEYGLIAALISISLIIGGGSLSKALNGQFESISNSIKHAEAGAEVVEGAKQLSVAKDVSSSVNQAEGFLTVSPAIKEEDVLESEVP